MAENQFVQHVTMGEVHVLRLANPPVNTLRTEIRAGLFDGMKAARAAGAKAVVIIGTGRMFCAGAEMTEFGKPRVPPSLNEVFEAFENFPGLTVAAIHGSALGGGLEVAQVLGQLRDSHPALLVTCHDHLEFTCSEGRPLMVG